MTRLVNSAACALALSLALLPTPALADEGLEDARTRGKQLFDAALADVKRDDFRAACPKFRASYEVDPKASTLLNLGTCYERNGQTASAWGAFSSAVVAARRAGREEWALQAEERVKALEGRLVRLTVTVPLEARAEGLVVERDTTRLSESEWGLAMAVDPGEHVIRAHAEGHVPWSARVTVVEGTRLAPVAVPKLALERRSPGVVAVGGPARTPKYWTPARVGGATLAGAGLVGLGLGAALAVVAKGKYDSSTALCRPGIACASDQAVKDNSAAFDLATGATVATVVGAVASVAGVGLFLWAPDKKSYALQVTPGRGYAGIAAGGAF